MIVQVFPGKHHFPLLSLFWTNIEVSCDGHGPSLNGVFIIWHLTVIMPLRLELSKCWIFIYLFIHFTLNSFILVLTQHSYLSSFIQQMCAKCVFHVRHSLALDIQYRARPAELLPLSIIV